MENCSKRKFKVMLAMCFYNHDVRVGVAKYAYEHGWELTVNQSWPANYSECGCGWDGIITQCMPDADYWSYIQKLAVPMVGIGYVPGKVMPYVATDERELGFYAAEFLLERGIRNFLCFSPEHGYTARMDFFKYKVLTHGAACENVPVPENLDNYLDYPIANLVGVLESSVKPVGVFVHNDEHALPVFEAARTAGLKVPDDVAIIGPDNDLSYCETTPVPLTSIDQDTVGQGYEAAKMLDRLMKGKLTDESKLLKPRKIVARKSTDIYAYEDKSFPRAMLFIRKNFHKDISVDEIADYCKISTRKLYQVIKRELGTTPRKALMEIRLDYAKRLLEKSNESLRVVAEKSGFVTNHNLYVTFKRELKMTPTEYREKSRNSDLPFTG